MTTLVHIERRGRVAILVLDRPDVRNAINVALAGAIVDAIESCQDIGAIVLTGADPAFCAGLDLRELGVRDLSALPPFLRAAARSKVPILAAVNGAAVTGGFELALACDFIIASERARFADTHMRVGVYPGPVLVDLPRRVGMARAREMTLTGNFVDAPTALRIGLANHVVSHDDLVPFAVGLAEAISDQDPAMVRAARQDWDATDRLPLVEAHEAHRQHSRRSGYADATGDSIAARREAVVELARCQR